MAHTKSLTVSIERSSSHTETEIELTGRVTQGPANTINRRVNFLIPNDDVEYAITALASWMGVPYSTEVHSYLTSYDRKRLAADYLRQLATKLEDQA